ncbi:16S rRNA (guanine(527)-N(7))-methyltransferase RsmG [Pseudaminobacter sp. 19-2017]|uniref:Ribosomal RNA small subunit methyltransferase G n=1 Tax=Pseudaminobacter soli (ex Zhang et al. 2022) TaxID=2831468 RepID=A0A942I2J3_9HYPH|nr:16S rRNA (guanine(527)-N(7))-methyltransferase RsmG [Pseudaminobacter soli]MBS3649772.1 16S rRNA (guanine(527)-N(7))-methyltransferase RsmG [Pseudaminobacter soli]
MQANDGGLQDIVKVAGHVSRETHTILHSFVEEFQRWNRVTNLVAQSTVPDIWNRHVLDSAQLLPLSRGALRWLDLGSGSGFPGLVVAILLRESPGAQVHLVESNRKKAAFLNRIVGLYGLPTKVHAKRIEDIDRTLEADVVTARALTSLPQLLRLAEPWLSTSAIGLFHKGRGFKEELKESSLRWRFELVEHESVIQNDSVVLEIRNLRRI